MLCQQVSEALREFPVEIRILFEPARMVDVFKPKLQDLIDCVLVRERLSNSYCAKL